MPHRLTKKCPANFFLYKIKYFVSLARPCCRASSGRAWTWGKKIWLLKKWKKEKKRAVLFLSCSLFIRWVAAGLARPATAAAAATGTTAATFIDWIDLAAPPVTFFTWHRFADPGYPNVGHYLPGSCMTWHHQHLHQRNTEHSLEVQGCDNHKNIA